MDSDLHADMAPIVRYVKRRLESAGMRVRQVGPEKFPAIVATYGKNGMLFSGHLDTVPVAGMVGPSTTLVSAPSSGLFATR